MKKHFICLANSFKYGGRCLAGIEIDLNDTKYTTVKNDDGTPKWIRPVSRGEHHELSTFETQRINVLDIVEIEDAESCPDFAHSKNVYYASLKKAGRKIELKENDLNNLCNNAQPKIFFNRGKAVPTDVFRQSGHSLMLIKIPSPTFYNDENEKLRVEFLYRSTEYDLPVTDPAFIDFMKRKGLDHINAISNYYFTISLGEELDGWHYKLVAGILSVPNNT
jgi:hypothetical protein